MTWSRTRLLLLWPSAWDAVQSFSWEVRVDLICWQKCQPLQG